MKRIKIVAFNETIELEINKEKYEQSGRVCLIAYVVENDVCVDVWGKITTNIPDVHLNQDEIVVKTHSENEWVEQLLTLLPEHFQNTGKTTTSGFATFQIWKFKE